MKVSQGTTKSTIQTKDERIEELIRILESSNRQEDGCFQEKFQELKGSLQSANGGGGWGQNFEGGVECTESADQETVATMLTEGQTHALNVTETRLGLEAKTSALEIGGLQERIADLVKEAEEYAKINRELRGSTTSSATRIKDVEAKVLGLETAVTETARTIADLESAASGSARMLTDLDSAASVAATDDHNETIRKLRSACAISAKTMS